MITFSLEDHLYLLIGLKRVRIVVWMVVGMDDVT